MDDEEKHQIVTENDYIKNKFVPITNEGIVEQFKVLNKELRKYKDFSIKERYAVMDLLVHYDSIVDMNIQLLGLVIVYLNRHRFAKNMTPAEKSELSNFINKIVIPTVTTQSDTSNVPEEKKNNITLNFISYAISYNDYLYSVK